MPLECHTLTMNAIVLQLSDAVADISMLQCSAQFRILIINAHFVADNASHALASSATARPTFIVEEEVVVIRNGWTPIKKKGRLEIYTTHNIDALLNPFYSQRLHKVECFLQGLSTTCFLSLRDYIGGHCMQDRKQLSSCDKMFVPDMPDEQIFPSYVFLGFLKCFFCQRSLCCESVVFISCLRNRCS